MIAGAGGWRGRERASLLAKRRAKVVVTDLGGAVDESGVSLSAAEEVVPDHAMVKGQLEPAKAGFGANPREEA